MTIPLRHYETMDVYILASAINMMLRDGEYTSLEDLCAAQEIDIELLKKRLKKGHLVYNETVRQFK